MLITSGTNWLLRPLFNIIYSILEFCTRFFSKDRTLFLSSQQRSIPPINLFLHKIENDEYEEALRIGREHKFDCDIVYKKQWNSSTVNLESIETILKKISDKPWVINECLQKIPEDYKSYKVLLDYAIFLIEEEESEEKHHDDYDFGFNSLKVENCLIINNSQDLIIHYKSKILKYLKRLSTYKAIFQKDSKGTLGFESDFFRKFRDQSTLEICINFARSGKYDSVEIMFTRYSKSTLPHRLPILSNFPETLSPSKYQNLFPYCEPGDSNSIQGWRIVGTQDDEFEIPEVLNFEEYFYFNNPNLVEFKSDNLTKDLVSKWFQIRAREIDEYCSLVGNAIELLQIGMNRNVPRLEKLKNDFDTYALFVYKCLFLYGLNEIDFCEFERLTVKEKMSLLMSGATDSEEKFVESVHNFLIPFVKMVEPIPIRQQDLLWDYLESVSRTHLNIVQRLFVIYHTAKELGEINDKDIIKNDEALIRLAIRCIYANRNADSLNAAFNIVDCLPKRDTLTFKEHKDLLDRVSRLNNQLETVEILDKYNNLITVKEIDELEEKKDAKEVIEMFKKITNNFCRKNDYHIKESDWLQLLYDLQAIINLCFNSFINFEQLYEIFVFALLKSGKSQNFELASKFMQLTEKINRKKEVLSFNKSMDLIVEAVKNYINLSCSISDSYIELAKECLKLVDPDYKRKNKEIQQEIKLIEALSILHNDFGLKMLPLQVRLMKQPRLSIICQAMSSKPKSYKKTGQLLNLAQLLNVCNEESEKDREALILSMIGDHAYKNGDYKYCWSVCQLIINNEHEKGWKLCEKLGKCDMFTDYSSRLELISFSLIHCKDIKDIYDLLKCAKTLKLKLLHDSLGSNDLTPSLHLPIGTFDLASKLINITYKDHNIKESEKIVKCIVIPGFYADAFEKNTYFPITLNWFDFCYSNSIKYLTKDFQKSMSKNQLLLRMEMLKEQVDRDKIKQLLNDLSFYALFNDTPFAVSCFIHNTDPEEDYLYSRFEKNTLTLVFLALYCYSLLACQENDIKLKLEAISMREMISNANKLIKEGKSSKYSYYVDHYSMLYCQYLQSSTLHSLDSNVDMERFENDIDYQRDTLLGLALTSDEKVFNILINIAHQYSVSVSQLYLTHLEYLIVDNEIDVETIANRILKSEKFLEKLTEHKDILQEYFEQRIFPLIDKNDHNRLVLCHQIIEKICFFPNEDDD